jgi:DNA polymerase III subunit gamma/tau
MAVLYRKYRPQKLSEVVGQDEVTSSLLKQLQSGNISHAYLFSGPRGTGKTSTARILAKALNCKTAKDDKFDEPCGKCESCKAIVEGRYLDLLEIDAASNRGIDEIRELREKIRLAPTEGKYKVYIIDEVHMLTNEAFNALLKTLEEPPAHAVFVLATTEPQKVPATILSRVQRFNFERPTTEKISKKLEMINKEEKWKLSKEVLDEIAKAADGAYRDAEVLLDKVGAVNPEATLEEALNIIGKIEIKGDLLDY